MGFPRIEDEYLPSRDPKEFSIDELCFRAREILSSYCLYETEMTSPGDTPDNFTVIYDGMKDEWEPGTSYPANDSGAQVEDYVTHERTPAIEISDGVSCYLDNIPEIGDEDLNLRQLLAPGYVALKAFHADDIDTIANGRSISGVSSMTTQIIFRLPWHTEGAGVYQGFRIGEDSEFELDETSYIVVDDFLEDLVDTYRHAQVTSNRHGILDFIVQRCPVDPVEYTATRYLSSS